MIRHIELFRLIRHIESILYCEASHQFATARYPKIFQYSKTFKLIRHIVAFKSIVASTVRYGVRLKSLRDLEASHLIRHIGAFKHLLYFEASTPIRAGQMSKKSRHVKASKPSSSPHCRQKSNNPNAVNR